MNKPSNMLNSKKKVVIVSGVTGQDGSHMVDYLLANTDHDIYGTVRRLSVKNHENIKHIDNPRFKLIDVDLTDAHSITNAVIKLQPDYYINLAAQSFVGSSWDLPRQTFQTNATAVLDILEAIRHHAPHCRFYNAGTSEEFGDVQYSPQDEAHPIRPRSPYGASKAAARHLVKVYRESYGLYAIQSWLFNHEGTRRGEEFVTRKITKGVARIFISLINGKPFEPIELGNMSAKRDWSDAEDFVVGIWMMLNQDQFNPNIAAEMQKKGWEKEGGILLPAIYADKKRKYLSKLVKEYVLASGETYTIAQFVEKAFEKANIDAELVFDGQPGDWATARFVVRGTDMTLVKVNQKFYRPAEVDLLLGTPEKICTDLGWERISKFDNLVEKMVIHDIELIRK